MKLFIGRSVARLVTAALLAAGTIGRAEPLGVTTALDRVKRGEPIRLGYRTNSPPLSFVRDGVAMGYTVDLCRAAVVRLARQLQRKDIAIIYVPVTIDNRMTKVAAGEVDMECGLTSNTVSRAKQVAFSPIVFSVADELL
jgi:glutamate/aspartate transport system substrate-binding protein